MGQEAATRSCAILQPHLHLQELKVGALNDDVLGDDVLAVELPVDAQQVLDGHVPGGAAGSGPSVGFGR